MSLGGSLCSISDLPFVLMTCCRIDFRGCIKTSGYQFFHHVFGCRWLGCRCRCRWRGGWRIWPRCGRRVRTCTCCCWWLSDGLGRRKWHDLLLNARLFSRLTNGVEVFHRARFVRAVNSTLSRRSPNSRCALCMPSAATRRSKTQRIRRADP